MTNYIPHPELGYKIAEKAVKQLIHSYLRLFNKQELLDTSRKLGIAYYRIPAIYVKQGQLLSDFVVLPKEFAKKDSLYYVPETSTPGEFKKIPRIDKTGNIGEPYEEWEIYLEITDSISDLSEREKFLSTFKHSRDELKNIICGIYNGARGVFYAMRKMYLSELNTLELDLIDKPDSGLYLQLRDSAFPNYSHPIKICFRLHCSHVG